MQESLRDYLSGKAFPVGTSHHPREELAITCEPWQCVDFVHFQETRVRDLPKLCLYGADIVGKILPTWGACYLNTAFFSSSLPRCVSKASPSCRPTLKKPPAFPQPLQYCSCRARNWPCTKARYHLHVGTGKGRHPFMPLKTEVSIYCTSRSCFYP